MKVLIVKTSSMGDVIHALPALTDAGKALPGIRFDWVVEENFAEIPRWHPLVDQVIPVAWRRWRKNLFSVSTYKEFLLFRKKMQAEKYDLVIDAQGLLKSALLARLSSGLLYGLDRHSARGSWTALLYSRTVAVNPKQHAIMRVRSLFSQVLEYAQPTTMPEYNLRFQVPVHIEEKPYLVFLHGTTWATKHWPEEYWIELAKLANKAGFPIKLMWGNAVEHARAMRIAASCEQADVLPRQTLLGAAQVLVGAKAIVAVDTGFGHLAAALDVPTVSLYGPSDPVLTGALGQSQVHLSVEFPCAPCFGKECTYRSSLKTVEPPCFMTLPPERVWSVLTALL